MKTYLEISITGNQNQQELLIPTMIELGCDAFQQIDYKLLCYIDKSKWTTEKYQSLINDLRNILHVVSVNSAVEFRELVEEDWNKSWERSLKPIEIGDKLVIKPSWCNYENKDNRLTIQIDPKMSFGTGYHETTRLTLTLLEKYVFDNCSILDVGTGTGILAIAAVKLGANSAVGLDNDLWSIENAKENIKNNHVEDKVIITTKTLQDFLPLTFDMIAANLTLNMIIEMLKDFNRLLKKNGILLLSGLLYSDQNKIMEALLSSQFSLNEIINENEWIAIASHKPL